ncbi:MAG: hypothetical protein IKQ00_03880 [Butyrivibrio sp.]|nr:hypothetical protein [Butyrivibrio sp.]
MIIFLYTFGVIFVGIMMIFGVAGLLTKGVAKPEIPEGDATAAMCTTQLLEHIDNKRNSLCDDFVIEQDMVYTYDSFNL